MLRIDGRDSSTLAAVSKLTAASGGALALLRDQLLGRLDADLDAGQIRIDLQRALPERDRALVLLELEVDLAETRQCTEMRGIALDHFVAVRKRAAQLAGEKERRSALVPAFGEIGTPFDDRRERRNR